MAFHIVEGVENSPAGDRESHSYPDKRGRLASSLASFMTTVNETLSMVGSCCAGRD